MCGYHRTPNGKPGAGGFAVNAPGYQDAMWLGLFAVLILIVAVIGSIASGGIFTIVLLPLGIVMIGAAVVSRGLGRRAESQSAGGARTRETAVEQRRREEPPLPHSAPPDPANHQPATPDQALEARLHQQ